MTSPAQPPSDAPTSSIPHVDKGLIAGLLHVGQNLLEVHERVRMDIPVDRDLHAWVVNTFRDAFATIAAMHTSNTCIAKHCSNEQTQDFFCHAHSRLSHAGLLDMGELTTTAEREPHPITRWVGVDGRVYIGTPDEADRPALARHIDETEWLVLTQATPPAGSAVQHGNVSPVTV